MLLGPILYGPHPLRHTEIVNLKVVADATVAFGHHGFPILPVTISPIASGFIIGGRIGPAPTHHLLFQRFLSIKRKGVLPMVRVVDGYMPIAGVAAPALLAPWKSGEIRQDKILVSQVVFVGSDLLDLAGPHTEIHQLYLCGLQLWSQASGTESFGWGTFPLDLAIGVM